MEEYIKWQKKYSELNAEYLETKGMMTEREIYEVKSHLKSISSFIEDIQALRQPPVMLSLPDDEEIGKKAHEWLKANYGKYKPSEWRAFIEAATWMRELSKGNDC